MIKNFIDFNKNNFYKMGKEVKSSKQYRSKTTDCKNQQSSVSFVNSIEQILSSNGGRMNHIVRYGCSDIVGSFNILPLFEDKFCFLKRGFFKRKNNMSNLFQNTNGIISIEFNNSKILTAKKDGKIYFGIKSICENIGIDYSSQLQKIKRDDVLDGVMVIITTTYGKDKKDTAFLPLEYLNGFLFTISLERLKNASAKEILIKYKKECYQVLANHFFKVKEEEKPFKEEIKSLSKSVQNLQSEMITLVDKATQQVKFVSQGQSQYIEILFNSLNTINYYLKLQELNKESYLLSA
jgi:hypothetical protein